MQATRLLYEIAGNGPGKNFLYKGLIARLSYFLHDIQSTWPFGVDKSTSPLRNAMHPPLIYAFSSRRDDQACRVMEDSLFSATKFRVPSGHASAALGAVHGSLAAKERGTFWQLRKTACSYANWHPGCYHLKAGDLVPKLKLLHHNRQFSRGHPMC